MSFNESAAHPLEPADVHGVAFVDAVDKERAKGVESIEVSTPLPYELSPKRVGD
jgi:hypothetical protein